MKNYIAFCSMEMVSCILVHGDDLFIAIFLRLGKFFWVWVAIYPAIIYIAIKIHQ